MDKSGKFATLTLANQAPIELPIISGTLGPDVLDIKPLVDNNLFTYDPGYMVTAPCESAITFIDGAKGVLLYRGYPVVQLAERCNFLQICYLLYKGELPNAMEERDFTARINNHSLVHDQIRQFFNGFLRSSHPMAMLCAVVGALSAFYHDSTDIYDPASREFAAIRIIAKMPTLAAMTYKYSIGQPFIYPMNSLGYTENFMHMMFSTPANPDYRAHPELVDAMTKIFILHADHEQNASTSTVRLAGSSQAHPFVCMASGIAALWGPAHGGANEAVLNMLDAIGHPDNIPKFIARAKDKNDTFRLMGFGHRVYKNFDPRAKVMKECCDKVLKILKCDSHLFDVARKLEEIALQDPYFIEKKLYPNVDFYSGLALKAMGFPTSMFTVIFALSRTVGWISHWNEMMSDGPVKIGRPRQLYIGQKLRNVPT